MKKILEYLKENLIYYIAVIIVIVEIYDYLSSNGINIFKVFFGI
jgi:hypothetical protein